MEYKNVNTDLESPAPVTDKMVEEFRAWDESYTVEALTDMSSVQIESRKRLFENRVQRLISEHSPGRLVIEDAAVAHMYGLPDYSAQEWEEARQKIWRKSDEVTLRFERAKGIVEKEEEAETTLVTKFVEAVFPDSLEIKIG